MKRIKRLMKRLHDAEAAVRRWESREIGAAICCWRNQKCAEAAQAVVDAAESDGDRGDFYLVPADVFEKLITALEVE